MIKKYDSQPLTDDLDTFKKLPRKDGYSTYAEPKFADMAEPDASEMWPYLRERITEKNASLQGWAQWSLEMMRTLMKICDIDIEANPDLESIKRRMKTMEEVVARAKEEAALPSPNVAVVMEGGLVQCVVSDAPDRLPPMKLMVIDYDTDTCDEDELVDVPQADGSMSKALAHVDCISEATIDLEAVARILFPQE